MNRQQILQAFLDDELIVERGYLSKDQVESFKLTDHRSNKMIEIINMAIEGVQNGDSQSQLTRKVNKHLDKA